jgi:hypothetical protein
MHKQELDGNASFSRFYMHSEVAKNTCNVRALSVSWLSNSTAIKPLLQQQILAVMDLSTLGIAAADSSQRTDLTPRMIPMHRLSDASMIVYRSAIALKLAPLVQRPALDIANQLVALFPTMSHDTSDSMYLNFSVEVVIPGWIHFRLREQSLATWLQNLIEVPPLEETERKHNQGSSEMLERNHRMWSKPVGDGEDKGDRGDKGDEDASPSQPTTYDHTRNHQRRLDESQKYTQNLFPVQYAHARCCSLLRLAHWQGLIKLRDLDFNTLNRQLIEPSPIPWLNDDQQTPFYGLLSTTKDERHSLQIPTFKLDTMNASTQRRNENPSPLPPTTYSLLPIYKTDTRQRRLRLVHPAEVALIAQIVDWLDEMSDPEQRNWVKLASAVSNAFDNFYSSCRIWGEVKTQTPKLAQARLGLVGVTQASLRALLEDQLGIPAPVEL